MLILTRRRGQRIFVGDEVRITVIRHNHQFVDIGIEAPKTITINREEIYKQKLERLRSALATQQSLNPDKNEGTISLLSKINSTLSELQQTAGFY